MLFPFHRMEENHVNRVFYEVPKTFTAKGDGFQDETSQKLLNFINDNVIGKDKVFTGPFGLRKGMYTSIVY